VVQALALLRLTVGTQQPCCGCFPSSRASFARSQASATIFAGRPEYLANHYPVNSAENLPLSTAASSC